jgi:prolipoprotein diacylglyceryl transferase
VPLASLPSPSTGVLQLGPLPLRAYAFCIILGVVVAIWLGNRRWIARGGRAGDVADIAVWAVPFGLVGGRLYHVVTTPGPYFGADGDPIKALYIWEGGLGVWGAIALGALGAWLGARRLGIALPPFADAVAPGIALAQAIGRWGNWFNQELFGKPSTLPWAVEISPDRPDTIPGVATYHPTFLYEFLYVALYTLGRAWIEALRIDDAHRLFGIRLNDWTSLILFTAAVAYIAYSTRRHPGREKPTEPTRRGTEIAPASPEGPKGHVPA